MDLDVTTFAMSDLGVRLDLRQARVLIMLGAIIGFCGWWRRCWWTGLGAIPSLVLGGPEDGDPGRGGRHVPSTSTDQVGATLMQWLGLPAAQFVNVFLVSATLRKRPYQSLEPNFK